MNRAVVRRLSLVLTALVDEAVKKLGDVEVPEWRFDGEEVKTAEEVATILGTTISEAERLLFMKDIYTGLGSTNVSRGIGTRTQGMPVIARARRIAYGRRRKAKKEKEA